MTNYRRKKPPVKDTTKKFSINEYIKAPEVRVIDSEGGMVGIMKTMDAVNMAAENGFDLIEINPKAEPPVVRMMDYHKFKYQQAKAQQNNKPKKDDIKTIRVSVRVSPHDLAVRAKKIDQFLEKGIRVKLQVQMKGREKAHPEVAVETMNNLIGMIVHSFAYESEPKLLGDSNYATIKPGKG